MILGFLATYLGIGLCLVFVGPLSHRLRNEFQDTDIAAAPKWKIFAYFTVLALGVAVLWPAFLPSVIKDERRKQSLQDIIDINPLMVKTNNSPIDADEFSNGHGDFGFSLSNPIPCNSVLGANLYLRQLTTVDGARVAHTRIGSFTSETVKLPVDGYQLEAGGMKLGTIYISPYQERNSRRAPSGFVLNTRQ